jgi:hypothetical protein
VTWLSDLAVGGQPAVAYWWQVFRTGMHVRPHGLVRPARQVGPLWRWMLQV